MKSKEAPKPKMTPTPPMPRQGGGNGYQPGHPGPVPRNNIKINSK